MFQTERTILRPLKTSDEDALFDLWNDLQIQTTLFVTYTVPRRAKVLSKILNHLARDESFFAIIEDKETRAFMGHVSLDLDSAKNRDCMAGISLTREVWGRGYGTEVIRWAVTYAFRDLGLHRVSLHTMEVNPGAIALYKKV